MKRIKKRWVLLGILCFFILAFCINMFVLKVVLAQPKTAFKSCFGFSLPESAEVLTCKVKRSFDVGRPNYAFEIQLTEKQYEEMKNGLEQYAEKNESTWSKPLEDEFFSIFTWVWREDGIDWKETNPKEIVFYAESGHSIGYDLSKNIHLTTVMITKQATDSYRMYVITS